MDTPNHDTELEQAIRKQGTVRKGVVRWTGKDDDVTMASQDVVEIGIDDLMQLINTYLYKQTLELIGEGEPLSDATTDEEMHTVVISNHIRAQVRKAAAERWGQA